MRRDFFDCMTQFHQRLCPPITLSPISQCVSLLRTPMSKHYSELCTANNTALSAAGKMLAQIQDQAATIRKLEAVFRQLHETTTTLNAKSAIYQKDLLENQRQVNYLKTQLYYKESLNCILRKRVNFLLADENRTTRKVLRIQGNEIAVRWSSKKTMDRAQWTLQSTSTEDTENNYFEGSLRVKRKKGKPSFTLNSEGTNPNNTVNDAAPAPAAEPNQSQFTAEELEQMWGDFASSFASTTTQPSDESQPISIASSATPLDFSVLQQVAYPAAATTGPTTFASATSSGSGEKPTSNVAAETAPLSSEDTSAEIPARKRPRLANLPQSTVGSNGFNDSGNVSGSKRPSYTPGVPIAVSNAVPVLSSGAHTSTSNPRQEHGNSRNGHPVMSAHAAAIASAHNGGSVGCDQVLAPDAAADALKTVQPWHTTKDGPVRQRMVDGMLRRLCGSVEAAGAGAGAKTGAAVVATGEGGEALPEWVEARRNRCMRVEAHLYHSSTSRGEYMYRVLK